MAGRSKAIQSVVRALSILNCLEEVEELQIAEISARLGLGRSTVHHLLSTLRQMNYVRQNPETKGYSLGVQAFKVGYAYFNRISIVKMARPVLEALCESTKETIHLGELFKGEVLYLDKIEGPMSISMRSKIGITKPSYCTGLGKILLAYQPEQLLLEIISKLELKPYTDNTITDKAVLLEEIAKCRNQGYAIDNEEIEMGLVCVAAPVLGISGSAIAAISVSAPKFRVGDKLEQLAEEVTNAAREVSRKMGQQHTAASRDN